MKQSRARSAPGKFGVLGSNKLGNPLGNEAMRRAKRAGKLGYSGPESLKALGNANLIVRLPSGPRLGKHSFIHSEIKNNKIKQINHEWKNKLWPRPGKHSFIHPEIKNKKYKQNYRYEDSLRESIKFGRLDQPEGTWMCILGFPRGPSWNSIHSFIVK